MIELQTVWGWQPTLYLFLGGLGAGTFLVAALVHLFTRKHEKIVCMGMWSAVAFLAVGLGFLLMEVTAPLRALMMWQSFSQFDSWMAIGAWLLFAGIVVFVIAAFAATKPLYTLVKVTDKTACAVKTLCSALGIVFALCIALYTGILLKSAPGVPFWNTGMLPALFTVSAIDTGVAFMAILTAVFEKEAHGLRFKMELATIALIIVETAVLVLFVTYMLGGGNEFFEGLEVGYCATATASAQNWLEGQLAAPFWGLVVTVGLAVPFVVAIVQCAAKLGPVPERALAVLGATCVLVGGCALRFITLLAGAHVDIVVNAIGALL